MRNAELSLIIGYRDIYDDTPCPAVEYLQGINKEVLLEYAVYYCHAQTGNPYIGFLNESDNESEYYHNFSSKVSLLSKKGDKVGILNIRTSLRLLELILESASSICKFTSSDIEVRERLLKAYLVLNDNEGELDPKLNNPNDPFEYLVIHNSLRFRLYENPLSNERILDFVYLWTSKLIKSILFFQYAEKNTPHHLQLFLEEFGVNDWKSYIINVHQIVSILTEDKINDSNVSIPNLIIETNDPLYQFKKYFIESFCVPKSYTKDFDFTGIKSNPVYYSVDEDKYCVLYLPFLLNTIFDGLYFKFKEINDKFKSDNSSGYIEGFRAKFGLDFSEKYLLNTILKDSFFNRYKHLGYEELSEKGLPDYYIRNGNKILLFENKDNLIAKDKLDTYNWSVFLSELQKCFIESPKDNGKTKPKAIKQLCNNIDNIINGDWAKYDLDVKSNRCVIYPIIVVQQKAFTLSGVNCLVNRWFRNELKERNVDSHRIKDVTIIDIDTLVIFQGVISEKKCNPFGIIDNYWSLCKNTQRSQFISEQQALANHLKQYASFDDFVRMKYSRERVISGILKQYLGSIS